MDDPALDPSRPGPLDRDSALRFLARADELLEAGELPPAAAYYQRVVGVPDATLTARALYGLGTALFRLDREDEAAATWQQILAVPETPYTYLAWREIARLRVREGDLRGAQGAYREAERRAPPQDRAEIASRLGWLAKETGDARGASRYFARSRGGASMPALTFLLIAATAVISIAAFGERGNVLFETLALDKRALAEGEYWRLFSVTLLHGGYLHLFFNMYALYLAGSLVEQLYGRWIYLGIYLLSAAAGSVGSFVVGGDAPSVGASGAIFGLFGVLLAVSRTHHPVLDRRGQMLLGQIGGLIVINLILGFGLAGAGAGIDNAAHVGGLVAGLWLGFLLRPDRVPTLGGLWQRPPAPGASLPAGAPTVAVADPATALLRLLGVLALAVAIAAGVVVGTDARRDGRSGGAADQTAIGVIVAPASSTATAPPGPPAARR